MTPISRPGVVLDRFELAALLTLAEDGLRQRRAVGANPSMLRYAADLIASLSAQMGRLSSGADSAPSERAGTVVTMDTNVRDGVLSCDGTSERWVTTGRVAEVENRSGRWVRIKAERGEYVGARRDDISGHWLIPAQYAERKVTP